MVNFTLGYYPPIRVKNLLDKKRKIFYWSGYYTILEKLNLKISLPRKIFRLMPRGHLDGVCGVTIDAILSNPVAKTLLSVVLLTPGIISKLSWTEAIYGQKQFGINRDG